MAGSENVSWWQYSRWVWNISRTLLQNPASGAEETEIETFLKFFWDPETETGSRPWLAAAYNKKSVSKNTQYVGDPDVEPKHVDSEVVGVVGRNLKETPITDAEVTVCDALFATTGNRRYREYP